MIKKILSKISTAVILLIAFTPIGLRAQDPIFVGSDDDKKPDTQIGTEKLKDVLQGTGVTGTENIGDLILKYVNFSLPYLALAAFLGFVYAGFLYVTAYGGDEQLQKSKKILIYSVVGLIVVILSYSIVQLLTSDLVTGIQSQTK